MADEELKKFQVETEDGDTIDTVPFDVLEKERKEKEELLAKLKVQEEKERNWNALNKKSEKTAEEKARAEEEAKSYATRVEALENRLKENAEAESKARQVELENAILRKAGGNKDLEEKMKFLNSRLTGEPKTAQEIADRVEEIASYARGTVNRGSAIDTAASAGGSGYIPPQGDVRFADTPQGRALAAQLGFKYVNKKQ